MWGLGSTLGVSGEWCGPVEQWSFMAPVYTHSSEPGTGGCPVYLLSLKETLKKSFFIFERQRQSMSRGGGERERETHNLKQAPGSELSAQDLTQGLNS